MTRKKKTTGYNLKNSLVTFCFPELINNISVIICIYVGFFFFFVFKSNPRETKRDGDHEKYCDKEGQ